MWKQCEALQEAIVSFRRDLHRIPEVGTQLPLTQAYIRKVLEGWGLSYTLSATHSTLWGDIEGSLPGKTVLLRADMDALPIQEATGLPFASQHEGKMHACGHDAHAAMLLGAIRVLLDNRAQLRGRVRFLFQADEEAVSGAKFAVKEGAMEGVDAAFGCHIGNLLGPDISSGTLAVKPGNAMASADYLFLTVRGKGCHGSTPEKGVDPITIASHIVINLQEILAREIPASQTAALTMGRIRGGDVFNIIPEQVELDGTLRTYSPELRQFILKRIEEIAKSTAAVFRGECDLRVGGGTGAVINDPALTALTQEALAPVAGEGMLLTDFTPNMGSEDFSCFQKEVPGVYWFLSSANREKGTCVPHHNPRFDIDEDVLWKGSAAFVAAAQAFLKA
ncbi:MAG: amidohydrolase [Clostridia bacterium]|nr:amidohydrolase [Clostridia bacterium]